jgi:hypothetical protein
MQKCAVSSKGRPDPKAKPGRRGNLTCASCFHCCCCHRLCNHPRVIKIATPTHVAGINHPIFTFLSGSFTRSPKYHLAIKGGQRLLRARTKPPPTSTLRPPLQQAGVVLLVGPNSSSSPRPPYQVGARALPLMHRSSRSSICPPTTIHQRAMQPGGQGVALECRSKFSSDSPDRNQHQHQHQHHRHLTLPKSGRYAKCRNK